ncbi:MAG: CDP-alcohol phosphatidyltransferase family protein [Gemmatimonadaceae bacterium]
MFDDMLRALKDRLFEPIARAIGPVLSPDWITLVAFLFGALAAFAASQRSMTAALVLWLASRFFDGLDGTAARVHGLQSDFGGYLDILLDFVVYAAIPIGLVIGYPSRDVAIAALVLMGSYFVNAASWMYLSAILEKRSAGAAMTGELTTITMPPAIIAGTETVIFFVLFLIVPRYLTALFAIMAVLVCMGVIQRLIWAKRHLTE